MHTVELSKMEIEHLNQIDVPIMEEMEAIYGPEISAGAIARLPASRSYTLAVDGEVAAIGGLTEIYRGLAEAWLFSDRTIAERVRKSFFKKISDALDILAEGLGCHRVQASAVVGDAQACRFLEHLGFSHEGIMRRYGPKREDFFRYAKLYGDEEWLAEQE